MSEEVFKKFLIFLENQLEEHKTLLMLVEKRYNECNCTFRSSQDFRELVATVQSKIESEKHRIFVHLKNFLAELKSARASTSGSKHKLLNSVRNNDAKRKCAGNSSSDISSDSDFFKKAHEIKDANKDSSSNENCKEGGEEGVSRTEDSACDGQQLTETDSSKKGNNKRSPEVPFLISEESQSMDSVQSDTKSSDVSSDLPTFLDSKFIPDQESQSADSVSLDSKNAHITSSSSNHREGGSSTTTTKKNSSSNSKSSLNIKTCSVTLRSTRSSSRPKTRSTIAEEDEDKGSTNSNLSSHTKEGSSSRSPPKTKVTSETREEEEKGSTNSNLSLNTKESSSSRSPPKTRVAFETLEEEEKDSNSVDQLLPSPHTSEIPECSASDKKTEEETKEEEKKKKGSERQIKRLEKLLGEIRDEIEISNAKELGLDELGDEDSAYVYEDRLQKKFVKVWEKLCELKNQDTTTGRPIERKFHYDGTRYAEVNKRIEKFINKKKIFPDYFDIKNIVSQVNIRCNLYLGKTAVDDLAREAFTDVGNKLQERRHRNFITTFGSSQTNAYSLTSDPAIYDTELRKKLDENRKTAKLQLDEVISKFSQKQYDTNAQPEEVDENAVDSSSEEEEEAQEIPELDAVMALDDDEDDEVREIEPTYSSTGSTTFLPPTKDLKIQLRKLKIPPSLQSNKNSIPGVFLSTRSSTNAETKQERASSSMTKSQLPPLLPLHKLNPAANTKSVKGAPKAGHSKDASEKIVIDLDDSSDAEENDISSCTPTSTTTTIKTPAPTYKEPAQSKQALVPFRPHYPISSSRNSNSNLSSSSSETMFVSTQSSMQFSMAVKTQVQQQQDYDGIRLKIASVASLAYTMKDSRTSSNSEYFTSQQTNYQNQNYQVTSGTMYNVSKSEKRSVAKPCKEVIVLSDSD